MGEMRSLEGSLPEDYCRLDADWLERRHTEEPLDEAGGVGTNLTRKTTNPLPSDPLPALKISEEDVNRLFQRMKTKKAGGPDNVSHHA
ncbi:hypothetical protein ATANTOWER_023811 [Ataeniobius toweri]|uniref:Uncharacterized protein n=1 Tax=Ataeniobius toweri TaxID=208326 RepID=A0ABU7B9N2_9TELE|nr:hypothetical protein [Ataeniobius toweri]